MQIRPITMEDDAAMAQIVRTNLRKVGLDIPGTAYFDPCLDHLSRFCASRSGRGYYVMPGEDGTVVGGVGFAEYPDRENCAELQKLYLTDEVKGRGYGYELVVWVKTQAKAAGYRQMYLETHSVLKAAIHLYEKTGFREIPRPAGCVHSTMDRFFLTEL